MIEPPGFPELPSLKQRQPFVPPMVAEIGRLSEMTLQISGGGGFLTSAVEGTGSLVATDAAER